MSKGKKTAQLPVLIDARELGRMLSMRPNTLLRLAWQGRLPCVRIGGCVRFDADEIARLVEGWRQPVLKLQREDRCDR